MHSDFVHLHLHSQYSLLDGACKLKDLIEICNHYKMPAVAVTDHGNLFGAIDFYSKAMAGGVKPIMGAELYLTPGSRFDKSGGIKSRGLHHITLLAKDEDGYKNLVKLVSLGFLEGFYYKPRIDKEALAQYSKGLICLSGCLKSEINQAFLNGNVKKAKEDVANYKDIFDKDSFYIELQEQFLPDQRELVKKQAELTELKTNLTTSQQDSSSLKQEKDELLSQLEEEKEHCNDKLNSFSRTIEAKSNHKQDVIINRIRESLRPEYRNLVKIENMDMTVKTASVVRSLLKRIFLKLNTEGIDFAGDN